MACEFKIKFNTLEEFMEYLTNLKTNCLRRSKLFDALVPNRQEWASALKAFLIVTELRNVDKSYLLEKAQYLKDGLKPEDFMDYWRYGVFTVLNKFYRLEGRTTTITIKKEES